MANGRAHPIKKRYYFPAEIFSADAVLISLLAEWTPDSLGGVLAHLQVMYNIRSS